MKFSDYEKQVTERFGKTLKDIMYELCVIRDVVPTVGAYELGVPKEVFIYWQNRFRYGPKQQVYDLANKRLREMKRKYQEETKNISVNRPLKFENEISLDGLEKLIRCKNEIFKKQLSVSENNHFLSFEIAAYEHILGTIEEYKKGGTNEKCKGIDK